MLVKQSESLVLLIDMQEKLAPADRSRQRS